MIKSKQCSPDGNLWSEVIKQVKQDLVSPDTRNALLAAKYFFFEPVAGDERDIRTFAGLCAATTINADVAARAVFGALEPRQQERILRLLKDTGFEGIRLEVVM